MFICSFQLCTKGESTKTGCDLNFGRMCIMVVNRKELLLVVFKDIKNSYKSLIARNFYFKIFDIYEHNLKKKKKIQILIFTALYCKNNYKMFGGEIEPLLFEK